MAAFTEEQKQQEMQNIRNFCAEREGECLEKEYKGINNNGFVKYLCKCKNGHIFWLTWAKSKYNGNWCPYCSNQRCYDEDKEFYTLLEFCNKHGITCLEDKYKGRSDEYKCFCKKGHEFMLHWRYIRGPKKWRCRECYESGEMEAIHKFCIDRGGACLETTFKGVNELYDCVCANGHYFKMNWNFSKNRDYWCKQCFKDSQKTMKNNRIAIEDEARRINNERIIREIEEKTKILSDYCKYKNWKLLNEKYEITKNDYIAECERGHVVPIFWHRIIEDIEHVCIKCYKENELKWMHSYCKSKEGECLDTKPNNNGEYLCKCKDDEHKPFKLTINSVRRRGSWCPICHKTRVDPEKEMQLMLDFCEKRNITLLETEFRGVTKKYKCHCNICNKDFKLHWDTAKHKNTGCNNCYSGFGEKFCRFCLEQMIGKEAPKVRPGWLVNSRNNKMELDCYCEELGLALEYQGEQHFRVVDVFKGNEDRLAIRKEDDKLKEKLCKENDVFLIKVPQFYLKFEEYNNEELHPEDIIDFILDASEKWRKENNVEMKIDIDIYDYYKQINKCR